MPVTAGARYRRQRGIVGSSGSLTVVGENAGLPGFAVGGLLGNPGRARSRRRVRAGRTLERRGCRSRRIAIARAGGTAVHETTQAASRSASSRCRCRAAAGGSAGVIQVVGDRTAELRTLGVLAAVLVGGGLLALALAALLGSLYATRALVPIRASLRRQREFAADTSHELRTPLAVIRAGVARVRQQPDARVSDVTPTLEAVERRRYASASWSTTCSPSPEPIRVRGSPSRAGGTRRDCRRRHGRPRAPGHEARRAARARPRACRDAGRRDRLRRLVTILVDNAIRHDREAGTALVTVRAGSIVVDDDGPGIPAADRARVFDRFWRGPGATQGGSGLGLAIAGWIVERHDGASRSPRAPSVGHNSESCCPAPANSRTLHSRERKRVPAPPPRRAAAAAARRIEQEIPMDLDQEAPPGAATPAKTQRRRRRLAGALGMTLLIALTLGVSAAAANSPSAATAGPATIMVGTGPVTAVSPADQAKVDAAFDAYRA